MEHKKLNEMGVHDGCVLKADDFLQNYELTIAINQYVPTDPTDPLYKISANPEDLKAKSSETNGKQKRILKQRVIV